MKGRSPRLPRWLRRAGGPAGDQERSQSAAGIPTAAALDAAARELEDRSIVAREPVAVVRFRIAVAGPGGGEALDDAVAAAQEPLDPYERLFRLSPADLVLLLPGVEDAKAIPLALPVRCAVEASAAERGENAVASCGISSSYGGEAFIYEWVLSKAEEALEESQERGRIAVMPSVTTEILGRPDP